MDLSEQHVDDATAAQQLEESDGSPLLDAANRRSGYVARLRRMA